MLNQEIRISSHRVPHLLFLITVAVLLGSGLVIHNLMTIGVLLILSLAIVFMIVPRGVLLGILLIRPSLDIFKNLGIKFGPAATLNINAVLAIFIIIFGISLFLAHRHNFLNNAVSKLFASFLAITFIWGILVSKNQMDFLAAFLRELSCLVIFCLGAYLFNQDNQIRRLTAACLISGIVPLCAGLYGLIERGFELPLTLASTARISSVTGSDAIRSAPGLAIWLMLASIIAVGFLFTRSKRSKTIEWTFISIVLYCLLILTYFRTAWAGFLAALICISVVKYRKMLIPIISAIAVSLLALPTILQRLPQTRSWYWRTRLWNRVIMTMKEDIVGLALGKGFGSASVLLYDIWEMPQRTIHNTYLEIFFATGLVGLTLFLVVKVLLLVKAYKLLQRDVSNDIRALAIIVFGMSIALFVAYMAQSITGPSVMWYYWIYAGALCGVEHRLEEGRNALLT